MGDGKGGNWIGAYVVVVVVVVTTLERAQLRGKTTRIGTYVVVLTDGWRTTLGRELIVRVEIVRPL